MNFPGHLFRVAGIDDKDDVELEIREFLRRMECSNGSRENNHQFMRKKKATTPIHAAISLFLLRRHPLPPPPPPTFFFLDDPSFCLSRRSAAGSSPEGNPIPDTTLIHQLGEPLNPPEEESRLARNGEEEEEEAAAKATGEAGRLLGVGECDRGWKPPDQAAGSSSAGGVAWRRGGRAWSWASKEEKCGPSSEEEAIGVESAAVVWGRASRFSGARSVLLPVFF